MESGEAKAVLEAVLFAMGEAVEVWRLAEVIGNTKEATRETLLDMQREYAESKRGIALVEIEEAFQLCTRGDLYEYLIKIARTPKKNVLSETLLETLSIIAYRQPITRLEMEKIRGVNCDYSVNRLLEYGLICEKGRLDAPGKPLLFGTSEEFLRSFGLKSLKDLPVPDPVKVEEFKIEAEQEVKVDLDV